MGIVFKNIESNYFLITNFKVMYSTLMRQPNLSKQSREEFIRGKDSADKYLLTRNPYARLESFYKDKFIEYPSQCMVSEKFEWQHCEKIFLNQYNVSQSDFEATKQALLNTSFEKFIAMLPSTYLLDGHLIPQASAFYYRDNNAHSRIKFDSLLKVEDEQHMLFLKNQLHIDTAIRENPTTSSKAVIVWNEELRKVVNTLYQTDFQELGYNMLGE
jgi:hypothetical protein